MGIIEKIREFIIGKDDEEGQKQREEIITKKAKETIEKKHCGKDD